MNFYRKHHKASEVRDQNKRMNFPSLIARDFQTNNKKAEQQKKQNRTSKQTSNKKAEQAKSRNKQQNRKQNKQKTKTHFHPGINESLSS